MHKKTKITWSYKNTRKKLENMRKCLKFTCEKLEKCLTKKVRCGNEMWAWCGSVTCLPNFHGGVRSLRQDICVHAVKYPQTDAGHYLQAAGGLCKNVRWSVSSDYLPAGGLRGKGKWSNENGLTDRQIFLILVRQEYNKNNKKCVLCFPRLKV